VLVAACKALAVLIVWKCLLLAWTRSTPTMAAEHPSVLDPSVISPTTTTTTTGKGKILTVVDVETRIRELEARHNADLQRHLDEYDGILEQIRQARQDLQPLRERVEQIRRQGAASAAVESTLDPAVLDDQHDADAAAIVTFPHLEALVSHLRQRQAGVKGEGDDDGDDDDDDDTARVRELFFRARHELYEHAQQQSAASAVEEADAGASPPHRGNNYTRANAILQSYAELNNWGDMLPPPRCPAPSDAIDAAASLSSPLTPAQIDEWMASNRDVQDRIEHVRQLVGDRTAVDDREWKVGLEATYEKVQERYMELAVHTNQVVFRSMKELQEHLDHWEVREAQKGITSNHNDRQAANNQKLGGVCVQTSQVLHWIDVGLDAHYRNRSVREAIATALLHDDALDKDHVQRAVEELVPDPVPDDDENDSSHRRLRMRRRRRYLRLLLDTPLLHESEKWIDQFVDWIEGRNDRVDQLVDLLASRAASVEAAQLDDPALASSSPRGEASIGRYLVRSFLEGAGALDDTVHRMLARP
jgi:hypothetical protein